MEQNLKEFLDQFFRLPIAGKKVRIPYWRNRFLLKGVNRIQGPFGGKGTPRQIRRATLRKARQTETNLVRLSSRQIRLFMQRKKIGLDCSGFVFQVLEFLKPRFWENLTLSPGRSNNPVRRLNTTALTAPGNSHKVKDQTKMIQIGDLIPLSFKNKKIDHVMVIINKTPTKITYAHSSSKTRPTGPHLGRIKITNPEKPLWQQEWKEKLADGQFLLKLAQPVLKKIGVRRIL